MFSSLIDKPKLPTRSVPSPSLAVPSSRIAGPRGAPPIVQAALLALRTASTSGPPAPVVARTLAWSDFPVAPARIDGHSAQTGFGTRATPNGFALIFNPGTSWSVVADQTDDLLRHEQYHLNLAAVLVNKANTAYAAGMDGKAATVALAAAMAKYQGDYETDTGNGVNVTAQAAWEADIDASVPAFPLP